MCQQLESGTEGEFEDKLFDYTHLLDHILEQEPNTLEFKEQIKAYSGDMIDQVQGLAQVDT